MKCNDAYNSLDMIGAISVIISVNCSAKTGLSIQILTCGDSYPQGVQGPDGSGGGIGA